MKKPQKIVALILAGLFVYLSIFTWNLRTGYLDALSTRTGLDISGFVIRPGLWVAEQATGFWEGYIYLVGLKQENDALTLEIQSLQRENMLLTAEARAADRLEALLDFAPPQKWRFNGARVIAQRMGPAGVLDTFVVDKGATFGVHDDMPVAGVDGVAGRVLHTGTTASSVLLLTDPNSRIAVVGDANRSPGVLTGQGYGQPLTVRFVNLNALIDAGELLRTSGLSGIFPKGLPVARVTKVQRSDVSLFLTVEAEPLVDVAAMEEVLLLTRVTAPPSETPPEPSGDGPDEEPAGHAAGQ